MYVKVIASHVCELFWETQCITTTLMHVQCLLPLFFRKLVPVNNNFLRRFLQELLISCYLSNGMLRADVEKEDDEVNERYDYRYMMNRDKRRWARADQDGDGLLTKAEFADFLHPEEVDHMKDVVIDVSTGSQSS